jgi:beta-phosphoglucomutase-like phosphatase (HAD superfamily)
MDILMIQSILFDLDGTLVQTEILKAESYAQATLELCPDTISKEEIIQAYRDMLGGSRDQVAQSLVDRFNLNRQLQERMSEFGVKTPWQAFIQIRMQHYQQLIADPDIIHNHKCPFALGLLNWAVDHGYRTGLATMSHCPQASRILEILGLDHTFDALITRDDVDKGKPDPEIYLAAARQLDIAPASCLVIEDSATGIQAALAAGMACLAVPSSFTRPGVLQSGLLPDTNITAPKLLQQTAEHRIHEYDE